MAHVVIIRQRSRVRHPDGDQRRFGAGSIDASSRLIDARFALRIDRRQSAVALARLFNPLVKASILDSSCSMGGNWSKRDGDSRIRKHSTSSECCWRRQSNAEGRHHVGQHCRRIVARGVSSRKSMETLSLSVIYHYMYGKEAFSLPSSFGTQYCSFVVFFHRARIISAHGTGPVPPLSRVC